MDGYLGPPDTGMRGDLACAGRPRLGQAGWQPRTRRGVRARATCPYQVYARSGLAPHDRAAPRPGRAARAQPGAGGRERAAGARGRGAARRSGRHRARRARRARLGPRRARWSSTCRAGPSRRPRSPAMKMKSRALGERIGYHAGRARRARRWRSSSAASCWCCSGAAGSPTCALPGADLRRVAAAAVLTGLLAFKIAARVRTAERRRTPRREAVSDAELGLLLLTTVYLLLAFSGGVGSTVYPLVYAVVSFLVTFHRLVGRAAAGGAPRSASRRCSASARPRRPRRRRRSPATPASSPCSRCSTSSSCTPRWRASAASTGAASRTRSRRCARRRATSA